MDQSLSISQILSNSWLIFKDHWKLVYQILLVIAVVNVVLQVPSLLSQHSDSMGLSLISVVFSFLIWFINLLMNIGRIKVFSKLVRGESGDIKEVFQYRHLILRSFGAQSLLSLLIMLLLGVLGVMGAVWAFAIGRDNLPLMAAGWLVIGLFCVAVLVYVSVRFQFLHYFIADQETSIKEAFSKSYDLTRGYFLKLFLLSLVVALLNLGGLLLLGLGLLITIPVTLLTQAYVYNLLRKLQNL